MITQRQLQLLQFIEQHIKINYISPSYDEMKEALGLNSKSAVHSLVTALESKEYIRRLPNRARGIELIKAAPVPHFQETEVQMRGDNVLDGGSVSETLNVSTHESSVELPFHGNIAAGMPLNVFENPGEVIDVPASFLSAHRAITDYFALKIVGYSMIEAGILDGDVVIMLKTNQVVSGDIVAALIDGDEVTLKRLVTDDHDPESICLEAANRDFIDQRYHVSRVEIIGKLAQLVRKYT
jgi:repressor LexA